MSLQVYVPWTRIEPETDRALREEAPDAERVRMVGAGAYRELFSAAWRRAVDFCIVEHDIEIHSRVMPEFEKCPRVWCIFPFSGGAALFSEGLGCVRFRSALMRRVADLPERIGMVRWSDLDVAVLRELKLAGAVLHVHRPPVKHFHRWEVPSGHAAGCTCPTCAFVAGARP